MRGDRDQRQASFPARFREVTGVGPSAEQAREFESKVERDLDASVHGATRTFWTTYVKTEKELDQLEADHRRLVSPDAVEEAAARQRIHGITYHRAAKLHEEVDDQRGRGVRFVLEEAAANGNLHALGLVGDPSDRFALMGAITKAQTARVPAWIRAARKRHTELLTPVEATRVRMLLNGQRIAGRSNGASRTTVTLS